MEIFWGAEGKGFSRPAWGVGMRDEKTIAAIKKGSCT